MAVSSAKCVHVLCAAPNGINPGMISVDASFAAVAEAAGATSVKYWRLWDQSQWIMPPGGSELTKDGQFRDLHSDLTFRLTRGHLDEFLDADAVVYWGDFLHMAVYQGHMADVLSRRIGGISRAEADDLVARHLMLRGQPPETLERVMSFGTTLMFNTVLDYAGTYGADLHHFVSNVRRIWLRDPYSASVAQAMRGADETCRGVDAAFLLGERHPGPREPRLGVFIGRSRLNPERVARLGRQLARRLDLRPAWIPWGSEPTFWPMQDRRRLRLAWPGLEHQSSAVTGRQRWSTVKASARGHQATTMQMSISELMDDLASCAVVLTDTYHLAVNAWRLGTPTICLTGLPERQWSVNSGDRHTKRDKRADLYSQIEANELLVDDLSGGFDHIIERLRNDPAQRVTFDRIDRLTAQSRRMVTEELRGLLSGQ